MRIKAALLILAIVLFSVAITIYVTIGYLLKLSGRV